MIPLLIAAGAAAAGAASNYAGQKAAADASYDQIQYQKWAQQQTWDREDNAVRRRTKDLIDAGLSPTLAAGGAAQASAPISVSQQYTPNPGEALAATLQPILAMSQLRQTDAQTKATLAQAQNTQYDTLSKNWHDRLTEAFFPEDFLKKVADRQKTYADTAIAGAEGGLRYDALNRSRRAGARPGSLQEDFNNALERVNSDLGKRGALFDSLLDIGVPGRASSKALRKAKQGGE